MKLDEPIGNPSFGPMVLRLAIGAWFMLAGIDKINHLTDFMAHVDRMNFVPERFEHLYAILVPYLEVGIGALLILGIWTTLGAGIAVALLASYIYPFGVFPTGARLFNKDLLVLAGAFSLLYSGAGSWSIDRFRKT